MKRDRIYGAQEQPFVSMKYCAACGLKTQHQRWDPRAKWTCAACGRACTQVEAERVAKVLDRLGLPKRDEDEGTDL